MTDVANYEDYRWVSKWSQATLGLVLMVANTPTDADGDVTATLLDNDGNTVFTRTATHDGTGVYSVVTSTAETSEPGLYTLRWQYTISAVSQAQDGVVEVGPLSPAYDALPEGFQAVVEAVNIRFADLFDSPLGGPHLATYYQTRFGRNRIAQLVQVALNRLNTIAQPHQTLTLTNFNLGQWGGLVEQAAYLETLKHLIRSYVEQPQAEGVSTARLDRRDYMQRWQSVLEMEQEDLNSMMDVFKISFMGLGRPRVLVSGGVFGQYGPNRFPGSAAARGYFWLGRGF